MYRSYKTASTYHHQVTHVCCQSARQTQRQILIALHTGMWLLSVHSGSCHSNAVSQNSHLFTKLLSQLCSVGKPNNSWIMLWHLYLVLELQEGCLSRWKAYKTQHRTPERVRGSNSDILELIYFSTGTMYILIWFPLVVPPLPDVTSTIKKTTLQII